MRVASRGTTRRQRRSMEAADMANAGRGSMARAIVPRLPLNFPDSRILIQADFCFYFHCMWLLRTTPQEDSADRVCDEERPKEGDKGRLQLENSKQTKKAASFCFQREIFSNLFAFRDGRGHETRKLKQFMKI